jgi:hypothetical protein
VRSFIAIPTAIALAALSIVIPKAAASPHAPPVPAGTCYLTVPANPLTAKGLATPYINSCTEPSAETAIIVQAAIISPSGQPFAYDPLVITQGTAPQVPPVVPVLAKDDIVAIWVGSDDVNTQLEGSGARQFVNGIPGSNFGQVAYSQSAPEFFSVATRDIAEHRLTVPALGTQGDGVACPTINSYEIGDQDPSDNTTATYLTNGTKVAQDTTANRALFPGDTTFNTGSDNFLLDAFIDPALDTDGGNCHPWAIPSLDSPGTNESTLAFDQLQAVADQGDPLVTPLSDEMTLADPGMLHGVEYLGLVESQAKTHLYQLGVDQSLSADDTEQAYCNGLAAIFPPFLAANAGAFTASPSPTAGQNLDEFLTARFEATWNMVLPTPGVVPTCTQITGVQDPVG